MNEDIEKVSSTYWDIDGFFETEDHLSKFVQQVDKSHTNIRKILGGVRFEKAIKVEKDTEYPLDVLACGYISELMYHLPNYLKHHNLKLSDLANRKLPSGMSVTKHIMEHAKRTREAENRGCSTAVVNDYARSLASEYAKHILKKGSYYICIDTSVNGFAKLGHYGCDAGSCFGNQGSNRHHKYRIALAKDSFVATISSNNFVDSNSKHSEAVARMWGTLVGKDAVCLSNFYSKKINCGSAEKIVQNIFEELFKTKYEVKTISQEESAHYIYINRNPKALFKSGTTPPLKVKLSFPKSIKQFVESDEYYEDNF